MFVLLPKVAINFKSIGQAPEKCPFRSCFQAPLGVVKHCSYLLQARKAEGCGVMGSKDGASWDDEITTDPRRVKHGQMLGSSSFLVGRKVCPVPHQALYGKQAELTLS